MIIKKNNLFSGEYTPRELKRRFRYILFAKVKNRNVAVVSNVPIHERGYCIIRESRRLSPYEQHMNSMLNGRLDTEVQRTYRVELNVIPEEKVESFRYEVYEMLGG